MLEIQIVRFKAQDIITTSVAETRPPEEITLKDGKCYCSVYGCNEKMDDGAHITGYQDPIGKGYLVCPGNEDGVHSCDK